MTNIKVVSYNPHRDGETYLRGVIDCYQKCFAGPPWNESHICTVCNQQYGIDIIESISPLLICLKKDCDGQLEEFWSASQVAADFLNETKDDYEASKTASSWIALDGDEVIGICWGYTLTTELLVSKVGLPTLNANLHNHFGDDIKLVAYLDELAVLPKYRSKKFDVLGGTGIAKALVNARHRDLEKTGVKVVVVLTLAKPPTRTYEWYRDVGFTVIDHYPENPNRVILARTFQRSTYGCFVDREYLLMPF